MYVCACVMGGGGGGEWVGGGGGGKYYKGIQKNQTTQNQTCIHTALLFVQLLSKGNVQVVWIPHSKLTPFCLEGVHIALCQAQKIPSVIQNTTLSSYICLCTD